MLRNKHLAQTDRTQEDISCRKAFCMSQNMLAAHEDKTFIGKTLIARPELLLTPRNSHIFQLEQYTKNHADIEDTQDHSPFIHSPMLHVIDEKTVNGEAVCEIVILNAPICHQQKLKNIFNKISKHLSQHPVYLGPYDALVNERSSSEISLLVPNEKPQFYNQFLRDVATNVFGTPTKSHTPFKVIRGERKISEYLSQQRYTGKQTPALAFRGSFFMSKRDLLRHVSLSDLYIVKDLPAEIALSPYPETKYIQAFEASGFKLNDIKNMPKWAADTKRVSTMRLN